MIRIQLNTDKESHTEHGWMKQRSGRWCSGSLALRSQSHRSSIDAVNPPEFGVKEVHLGENEWDGNEGGERK